MVRLGLEADRRRTRRNQNEPHEERRDGSGLRERKEVIRS
jgi:hypothetical protein